MSLLGQSRHFDRVPTTSALPLRTDMVPVRWHVSKVPEAEVKASIGASSVCESWVRFEHCMRAEHPQQSYQAHLATPAAARRGKSARLRASVELAECRRKMAFRACTSVYSEKPA